MTMHHASHCTHYTRAIDFIQRHGHFAAITKDGLLAMGEVVNYANDIDPSDSIVAMPEVFEVDDNGMVASADVRKWLGY